MGGEGEKLGERGSKRKIEDDMLPMSTAASELCQQIRIGCTIGLV